MFVCPNCGLVHEPVEGALVPFTPLVASPTTGLAVSGDVRYLAVWRLSVTVVSSCWDRIGKVAAPAEPMLFVPAFSLARAAVQQIGVSLTEGQPVLQLSEGFGPSTLQHRVLVDTGQGRDDSCANGPEFGVLSPVLTGRRDAHALAHFVYLAVESHAARDLRQIDYELKTTKEELVYLPAVWDPRYIHDANWRLLLREFDDLVA
jgi:hypothetical protein